MAFISDYAPVGGTVTLTSGSANFTTSGAALSGVGIAAGDEIRLKGWVATIAAVSGSNAGTLVEPWGQATQTAQPLRIRYAPDQSRVQASVIALINRLSGGNLDALVGLTLGANNLLYADGPGSLAQTPLTAFARSLLDDADAAAVYATLGEVPDPRLPLRLRAAAASNQIADFNANVPTGWYTSVAPHSGGPGGTCILLHIDRDGGNNVLQIATSIGTDDVHTRRKKSGTWGVWSKQYGTLNVNGPVSGTYAAPTGSIIERGSNANGSYSKFADGTMICTHALASSATEYVPWTFPAAFAAAPRIAFTPAVGAARIAGSSTGGVTTTSAQVGLYTIAGAFNAATVHLIAIGLWSL